jgi:hypothetical protein
MTGFSCSCFLSGIQLGADLAQPGESALNDTWLLAPESGHLLLPELTGLLPLSPRGRGFTSGNSRL